jgi:flavin-dependent dehydrogenase
VKRCDALVIGGGPAGATAAIMLARAGWNVVVAEKTAFPRRKVCGEFISATTWPVLRELGVEGSLASTAGLAVTRVGFFIGQDAVEAPMPGAAEMRRGRAIGRDVLDTALLEAASRAGAEIRQPCCVGAVRRGKDTFTAALRGARGDHRDEIDARIVIDAHGSWERDALDPEARRPMAKAGDLFGFKARFGNARLAAGLMPLVVFPGGYGGLVHSDGGEVSFSCCIRRDMLGRVREANLARNAGDAVLGHVRESCRGVADALAGATIAAPWVSAGPIRPGIRARWKDGVFALGNAAGEAHPLVAEGISMAIQSGWLAGESVAAAGELSDEALRLAGLRYAARWKADFAPRVRASAVFAALTTRGLPAAASVALMRRVPSILTWGAQFAGKDRALRSMGAVP